MKSLPVFLILLAILSCRPKETDFRIHYDLSGTWQFSVDTGKMGIIEEWYHTDLKDSIQLPGTTDMQQKGFFNTDTTTLHLNRFNFYEGPAWYRKKIIIPGNFKDKHIELHLERTKSTKIWIDDHLIGGSKLLQSPQVFDLTSYLNPGEHYITIQVDNSLALTPYGNVHIYSDDTQTNWNGIIGEIYLEASQKTYISNLQVYPDIHNNKIDINLEIENQLAWENVEVEMLVEKSVNGKIKKYKSQKLNRSCDTLIQLEFGLNTTALWDEYSQPIYNLTVIISKGIIRDSKTISFGMREFAVEGTQFSINGRKTFLRGKHDACVFPLSGHPPMGVESWKRIFEIAQSYGINHYRFHSYCPPEAAFKAADEAGIYLQVELPFWGGLESDSIANMQLKEGLAMLKAYANHPSFVMFSPGNEIWGGHDKVEKNIMALKAYDDRPLYTMGSNNNIGYMPPRHYCEFFVGARTPYAGDTILSHTRLTHAYADSREGGILNSQVPSTLTRFDYSVSSMKIPIVGHEIGQYQVYPDFREIEKYTGVLKPWNLEVFRKRLLKAGMYNQNIDFQKASGAWSAICYKAEMEAAIRTPGFAGFQLLDLQDFPGQGTALVGMLDAFMDDKGIVNKNIWLHSCNDVVILLEFVKYCWNSGENFIAKVSIANYSDKIIRQNLNWTISHENNEIINKGTFSGAQLKNEGLTTPGEISVSLPKLVRAEKLLVELSIENTSYSNSYSIWVYPEINVQTDSSEIIVTDILNSSVLTALKQGKKVLLFPNADYIQGKSVPGLFPPDFWNYGMFKGISEWVKKPVSPGTLGLLMDPGHAVFNSFPTDFHTNWQWFSIIKAGNPLILDVLDAGYRPIVQVIDNLERNHKLGLIFEFRAAQGKLLVCMSPLDKISSPEAQALYHSLLLYMSTDKFNPDYQIDEVNLLKLLGSSTHATAGFPQ